MSNPNKLGIETDAAGEYPKAHNNREKKLAQTIREDRNIVDNFPQTVVVGAADGGTASMLPAEAAAGALITWDSGNAKYELYYAAVESTGTAAYKFPTIELAERDLYPGLFLPIDANQTDGPTAIEIGNGNTLGSRAAYVVGTDAPFYMEAEINIDDISDVTEMIVGWRKAEAYQADPDDYDEAAAINVGAGADGRFNVWKILNGAATSTTNTGLTAWADTETHTVRVEVDAAGHCTFKVDGTRTTVASMKFDDGEVVVPFLHLDSETGDPGCQLITWTVGTL